MLRKAQKIEHRTLRRRRVRAKISGTATRPRVSAFRSLRGFYLQAIDDTVGKTLAAARLEETGKKAKNTIAGAEAVGELLGKRLSGLGVEEAVFDRGGYKYHGRVKAAAEALRKSGIKI